MHCEFQLLNYFTEDNTNVLLDSSTTPDVVTPLLSSNKQVFR